MKTREANAMQWHVPGTFLPCEVTPYPYLYTAVLPAAPAHVHTLCQSNKASTNRWLLFSSVTPTTSKHVDDLYSQSHSGLQAFSFIWVRWLAVWSCSKRGQWKLTVRISAWQFTVDHFAWERQIGCMRCLRRCLQQWSASPLKSRQHVTQHTCSRRSATYS